MADQAWTDEKLRKLERTHPDGLTVQEIVAAVATEGERLTEATFRKYVQLGLLPRSTRVGRKGKHRGSHGLYPVETIRQIERLRGLMREGFTIEQIQQDFLFFRREVDALTRQLEQIFERIDEAQRKRDHLDAVVAREVSDAKQQAARLIRALESIEKRLSIHARMARHAV